jgi:hypothetical protein
MLPGNAAADQFPRFGPLGKKKGGAGPECAFSAGTGMVNAGMETSKRFTSLSVISL